MHNCWYPVLIPDREVRTMLLAPRSTSHWQSSSPNPPKPPMIMYVFLGLQDVLVIAVKRTGVGAIFFCGSSLI